MSQTLGPIGKPTESPQSSKPDKRCSHGMSAIDGEQRLKAWIGCGRQRINNFILNLRMNDWPR